MRKPEILAPAGSLNKLKVAIDYGADAVYLGGGRLNLRAFSNNFTFEEIAEGVKRIGMALEEAGEETKNE